MAKFDRFLEENAFDSISYLQNNAIYTQGKIVCGSRGWMCEDKMTAADEKILQREALRFRLSLAEAQKLKEKIEGEEGVSPPILCFSHYPVVTAAQRENPILDVLEEFEIRQVYYGHLHNWGTKPLYDEWKGIRFMLVSSDYRNFTPVRID
jgi:predicted phosphohydrolase